VPSVPYIVAVKVYQSDGSTPRSGAVVLLTNYSTGDTLTETSNSAGEVVYDLGNMTNGYSDGDRLVAKQVVSHDDVECYVSHNGGATYPTWVRVDNNVRTRLKLNTARIKIDLVNHPAGQDVNITRG
jgi:hypothetical protein